MLQERDERGGNDTTCLGLTSMYSIWLGEPRERVAVASRDALVRSGPLVEVGVGLRDVMLLLLVGGEIDDLVGDAGADRERGRLLLLELGDRLLGELLALLRTTVPDLVATSASAYSLTMLESSNEMVRLTLR